MGYTAKAGCTNCGKKWSASITAGTSRDTWEKSAVCPKCKTKGHIWTSVSR